jgi:hypothetical protein
MWLQLPGGAVVRVAAVAGARSGDLVDGERVVFRHPSGVWPAPGSDGARFSDGARWVRLRERAAILGKTRAFFEARGFFAVETPLVVDTPGTEVHITPTAVLQSAAPGERPRTPLAHPLARAAHEAAARGRVRPPSTRSRASFATASAGATTGPSSPCWSGTAPGPVSRRSWTTARP